jgi:hypothetical protein
MYHSIIARQELGKKCYHSKEYTFNNKRNAGCIAFYAVLVISRKVGDNLCPEHCFLLLLIIIAAVIIDIIHRFERGDVLVFRSQMGSLYLPWIVDERMRHL